MSDTEVPVEEAELYSSWALCILTVLLIGALWTSYYLQIKRIRAIHETVVSIFSGMIVGLIIRSSPGHLIREMVTFQHTLFFNLLLPPIILNSGYELKQENFFRNFGVILTFAFAGTFISAVGLGVLVYIWSFLGFEGLRTLSQFHGETITIYSMVHGTGIFLISFSVSMALGVMFGLACSLMLKHSSLNLYPGIESCLVTLIAYTSYFFSNGLTMSGIVSLLFCGITLKHYAYHTMSRRTQRTTKYLFAVLAQLSENFIFIYLGLTLFTQESLIYKPLFILVSALAVCASRYLAVFPLSYLINSLVVVVLTVICFGGTTARMLEVMGIRCGVEEDGDSSDDDEGTGTVPGSLQLAMGPGSRRGRYNDLDDYDNRASISSITRRSGGGGAGSSIAASDDSSDEFPSTSTDLNMRRHSSGPSGGVSSSREAEAAGLVFKDGAWFHALDERYLLPLFSNSVASRRHHAKIAGRKVSKQRASFALDRDRDPLRSSGSQAGVSAESLEDEEEARGVGSSRNFSGSVGSFLSSYGGVSAESSPNLAFVGGSTLRAEKSLGSGGSGSGGSGEMDRAHNLSSQAGELGPTLALGATSRLSGPGGLRIDVPGQPFLGRASTFPTPGSAPAVPGGATGPRGRRTPTPSAAGGPATTGSSGTGMTAASGGGGVGGQMMLLDEFEDEP
uniref:Cation/H+ exchanger transmembrane domain-containing protein n=1 Tax=Bartheletia paradoxa TaxID=669517 RepID=A0A2D0XHW5_9BASI|nr:hypothetical protein SPAR04614 [Bartheletia paradoxa]